MPYGSLSHVGLAKEDTFGTPVVATDYVRFSSEGFDETIEQVKSDILNGVVDEAPYYEGMHTIKGDLSFDVYPNIVGNFLRAALGAPVTTQVITGVYQHVFTPTQANFANNCALPPYTFEVNRDLGQAFQYAGSVVDELTFNFGTDKKIMSAQAAIIAKALALITKTTPSFDVQDPFTWNQSTITFNGSANANFSTLEFGVKNSLEGIPTLDGTRTINRILRKDKRTFPVKFTLELQDMAEYNLFKAQNEIALSIVLTGGVISGSNNYKIQIDVPKFHFNTFPIAVKGAGVITAQVDGWAEYDPSNLYGMKVTLVNSKASY
jgi:hypothetical protein